MIIIVIIQQDKTTEVESNSKKRTQDTILQIKPLRLFLKRTRQHANFRDATIVRLRIATRQNQKERIAVRTRMVSRENSQLLFF
jgi:hypothetical protein